MKKKLVWRKKFRHDALIRDVPKGLTLSFCEASDICELALPSSAMCFCANRLLAPNVRLTAYCELSKVPIGCDELGKSNVHRW